MLKPSLRPFVHTFSVNDITVAYDVNTNRLFEASPAVLAVLEAPEEAFAGDLQEYLTRRLGAEAARMAIAQLRAAQQQGLFSVKRPSVAVDTRSDRDRIQQILSGSLARIVLFAAEDCNLRCRYCPSRVYGRPFHQSTAKRMSVEVARGSVDFLFAHSRDLKDSVEIRFYGGEPLLNEAVVRETIEYATRPKAGRAVVFRMATNGTLLSEGFAEFLMEKRVPIKIDISLDGPKHIHDANRILPDGSGSFDILHRNLLRLRARDSGWFADHVSFQATVAAPENLRERDSFFATCDLTAAETNASFVSMADVVACHSDPEAAALERNRSADYVVESLKSVALGGDANHLRDGISMLRETVGRLQRLHERSTERLSERMDAGLKCDIGANRLAVSADGRLYPCERFWCSLPDYCIGDVTNGFDIESILRIRLKILESSADRCRNCWAQRMCSQCPLAACGGDLTGPKRDAACEGIRQEVEHHLRLYYEICREDAGAIERLETLLQG